MTAGVFLVFVQLNAIALMSLHLCAAIFELEGRNIMLVCKRN